MSMLNDRCLLMFTLQAQLYHHVTMQQETQPKLSL